MYRAGNPVWAKDTLSGFGASMYGGRFKERGVDTLYTAPAIMTAIREANQAGFLRPTTLVHIEDALGNVFDALDPDELKQVGFSAADLESPWRDLMKGKAPVPSNNLADKLIAAGYNTMLAHSFALGVNPNAVTHTIWLAEPGVDLKVIDDEGRLAKV